MKKSALILALIIAIALPSSALTPTDLVGLWESKWTDVPSEMRELVLKEKESLDIKADSTFYMDAQMQTTILGRPSVDMYVYVKAHGKWTLEADSVTFNVDPASIEIDFPEEEIRIMGLDNPDQESMIKSQMHYNFTSQVKEMRKELDKFTYYNLVVIEEKKGRVLECSDPANKIDKRRYTAKQDKKKKKK